MNSGQAAIVIATVVNAVSVVVLAIITFWYARSTSRLLDESKQSRQAAERQAMAAEESLNVLKQQIADQADSGKSIVRSAIESTIRQVAYWKSANITNMAGMHTLPAEPGLVPKDDWMIIQHAKHVAPGMASELTEIFDLLRLAETKLQALRTANDTNQALRREGQQFQDLLAQADKKLAAIVLSLQKLGPQQQGGH